MPTYSNIPCLFAFFLLKRHPLWFKFATALQPLGDSPTKVAPTFVGHVLQNIILSGTQKSKQSTPNWWVSGLSAAYFRVPSQCILDSYNPIATWVVKQQLVPFKHSYCPASIANYSTGTCIKIVACQGLLKYENILHTYQEFRSRITLMINPMAIHFPTFPTNISNTHYALSMIGCW